MEMSSNKINSERINNNNWFCNW